MRRRLLIVALLVCSSLPAWPAVRGIGRQCRAQCGPAIHACVDQGGRRRKCKRQIIRSCKQQGIAFCVPADTYAVATTGTDVPGCGSTSSPCRTIQFVLDSLVPIGGAGTIKVAAGRYDDVAVCPGGPAANRAVACILNQQITLRGGFSTSDWETPSGDPGACVVDGKDTGRGLHIVQTGLNEAPATLVMDGFTIENGLAQGASSGTTAQTWAFGGGLLAENGIVTLRNMVFRNNRAIGGSTNGPQGGRGAGGGVALNASGPSVNAPATLENVRFEGNQAIGGSGLDMGGYALGGGLFTYSLSLTADGLVLTDNAATAGSSDGDGSAGTELGDALGGAIAIELDSHATLRHVQASGNTAAGGNAPSGSGGGGFGGALFAELADVTLADALIAENTARGGSGRNDAGGSIAEGGGVHAIQSNLTIERSVIVGNRSLGGDGAVLSGPAVGGGVALVNGSSPGNGVDKQFLLRNVVIADNGVDVGSGRFQGGGAGGVWVQASVATLEHVTIAGNRLLNDQLLGAGMAVIDLPGWQTHAIVTNSIVADHTDPGAIPASWGNAAVWAGQGTQVDLTRTLFANNVHDSNAGITGGPNLPPGTFGIVGTITAGDAGFVSPGSPNRDYHLQAGSPAVDQGDPSAVSDDVDGDPRPHGALPDIGADERTS
jgi:hypothetical protein